MQTNKNYKNKNGRRQKPNNNKGKGFKVVDKQPRKDSNDRRVNYDNTRESKFEKDIERDSSRPGANDISELNKNPELTKSAGSLPFASIIGQYLHSMDLYRNSVPGVMILPWSPNYGYGQTESVLNKAYQQIYSFIVHANSRNYKYEYSDLAIYDAAGIEVFAAIAEAIRVYGLAKAYTEENLYYGNGLIAAAGFDPKDIRNKLGQMWFDINNLIMQTRQIWIPNVLPLMNRWIRMNSELYTDAAGKRSQTYMYIRTKYFQLSETGSANGTCLVPACYNQNADGQGPDNYVEFTRIGGSDEAFEYDQALLISSYTWNEFKSMIDLMINQLVASQDRGMIYGDILKAYGADKIYAMPEVDVSYTVFPVYNTEMLMQIENVTICRNFNPCGLFQTPKDVPNRLFMGFMKTVLANEVTATMNYDQILNLHVAGQPSPETVLVATRHKSGGTLRTNTHRAISFKDGIVDSTTGKYAPGGVTETANNVANMPVTCGSEVVNGMWVMRLTSGLNDKNGYNFDNVDILRDSSSAITSITYETAMEVQAFDWHPFFYEVTMKDDPVTGDYSSQPYTVHGDFDNYIEISDVSLAKLNDVCFYSLYGIPQF